MSAHGGAGTGYVYGSCRCEECTKANTQRVQRRRNERMAERVVVAGHPFHRKATHGTTGGYKNWGCRCHECVAANSNACAAWREGQ